MASRAGSVLARLYLLAYNLAQFAGWATVLWRVGGHAYRTENLMVMYSVAGELVGERCPVVILGWPVAL